MSVTKFSQRLHYRKSKKGKVFRAGRGMKPIKVSYEGRHRHERYAIPSEFDKRSFRTKVVSKDTRLILACPKGKYSAKKGKCKVTIKLQSKLKRMRK